MCIFLINICIFGFQSSFTSSEGETDVSSNDDDCYNKLLIKKKKEKSFKRTVEIDSKLASLSQSI
jgi:hypothetical protein